MTYGWRYHVEMKRRRRRKLAQFVDFDFWPTPLSVVNQWSRVLAQ